jgi:DNA processing protein
VLVHGGSRVHSGGITPSTGGPDGRTVATIGTGLDHTYPKSNLELQQEINSAGLALGQFRPEQGPTQWTFPMRNATVSGYACASVIAEASEHSGTRIQGRVAFAHWRPVILTLMVAETTTWGPELTERPGVHVVSLELAALWRASMRAG